MSNHKLSHFKWQHDTTKGYSPEKEGQIIEIYGSFEGVIDEHTPFDTELLNPIVTSRAHIVQLDLSQVIRINSVGMRNWIKSFDDLRRSTTKPPKIILTKISPTVVEQINLVQSFVNGIQIESVACPYTCQSCAAQYFFFETLNEVKSWNYDPPEQKCPKCEKLIAFDDSPEDYFTFMDRMV